jgi:Xaa-Pro aminopeptidase
MSEPAKKTLFFGRRKDTGSYYSQARPITWEMLDPCGQLEVDEDVYVLFTKEPFDELAALRAELAKWMNGSLVLEADKRSLAEELARLKKERETFYMDYRLKCDAETKAAHERAEKAERERDEAREACVNSANAWLAAANHAEKAEQERDHAVAATRELLATNIRSCALSRTTRGIDGMIRDELLRLAERVKTNAWEQ